MTTSENVIMMANKPQMETISKTAEILGLPEYFVRTKVKSGEIVAIRAGRKVLINVPKFVEYLNTHTLADDDKDKLDANDNPLGITPIEK